MLLIATGDGAIVKHRVVKCPSNYTKTIKGSTRISIRLRLP